MILLTLTFVVAVLLAMYGVPIARRAALKFGIVDNPDGRLKHQREPVPYLGGLAIYLAFLVSLAFTFEFRQDVLGIVLSGTLIVMLGLIDDFGVFDGLERVTDWRCELADRPSVQGAVGPDYDNLLAGFIERRGGALSRMLGEGARSAATFA